MGKKYPWMSERSGVQTIIKLYEFNNGFSYGFQKHDQHGNGFFFARIHSVINC